VKLVAWAKTDLGSKRAHNEDSLLVDRELALYAVADGMGGHLGGEHASKLALEIVRSQIARSAGDFTEAAERMREDLRRMLVSSPDGDEEETVDFAQLRREAMAAFDPDVTVERDGDDEESAPASVVMRIAARQASISVYDASRSDPRLRGMGTTLTAMLFESERMHLVHAGDSRAFLFRDGKIRQLTEDHSWIHEQVKAGIMSAQEAALSELKHIITRSIGVERDVDADVTAVAVEAGDCYLLCSDGLSNYVGNDELEKLMSVTWYRKLPDVLVDIANERGGDDNITVVVVYAANEL
jgi:protein phosphatase